jgi:hypothetical protein
MKRALEELLGGDCYHMERVVFGSQPALVTSTDFLVN